MAYRSDTNFAPPERLGRKDLERQAHKVAGADYPAAILDGVNVPVFVLNEQRQIVFANSAFRQFIPEGESFDVMGRRAGEAASCIHANEEITPGGCGTALACRNCEALLCILHAQTKGRDERTFQLALKDGNAINANIRATRIKIDGENFIIVALVDIKDTLWRRDAERAFLHDVMNIAGSIRGSTEAMSMFDAEKQKSYIARIIVACDTLINEINSHRLMIQAEDGNLDPTFESLESLSFLNQMLSIVDQHEVSLDRKVILSPDASGQTLESDHGLLSRVILNLLKNALEASQPGQIVTANTGCDENGVWFSVHNETSMSQEVQCKIFRRFFSTRGASRGIGTYSARLLTERYLGGSIYFTTTPESGTIFTARFPLVQPRPNKVG